MTAANKELFAKEIKVHDELVFHHLPAYAQFLSENKLRDFVTEQLRLSREVKIPLLKFFESWNEEQLIELGMQSAREMLTFLAQNKVREFVQQSVKTWVENQIPVISRDEVVAEDITLVSFIRRKAFRNFLTFYTADIVTFHHVMEEVDRFTVELDTICFKTLLDLHRDLYKESQAMAHIGNWVWELESGKLSWSDELFRIYELEPRDEITYEYIFSFNHPDDAEFVKEQMKRSLTTLQPFDFYYRIVLKNGREKFLHVNGEVQLNERGIPCKMFGTLQDATAQKLIEKELSEKQNFIHKIADVTPSLIAAYNVHTGKYIFINQALETILGYNPEDVLKEGVSFFRNLVHPDDLQPLNEKNAKALELANSYGHSEDNKIFVEFEYRLRHRNGQYRWFHTYGTIFDRNKNKQVEHVLNISVDVTEEYLLREHLKLEKAFAELIIDNSVDLIGAYDINQRFTAWNKKCEERYHLKKEEVLGKHILEVFPRLQGRSEIDDLNKALSGILVHYPDKSYDFTTEGYHELFLIPLKNNDNKTFGALVISHDITQIKKTTNELHELNLAFSHAEEIAGISHWQWNINTNQLTFSDNQYRLLGCEPQSFESTIENYLSFVHPDDRDIILKEGKKVLNEHKPSSALFRVIRKDGSIHYFQSISKVIANQLGEQIITGINQDITEQHLLNLKLEEQNEAIRKSEERYHRMINEVQDYAILLLTKEGIIENWNKGAEKIKGYKAEEIIGKNFRIFYTEEDQGKKLPERLIQEAAEKGKATHEGWRVRKDGTAFWGSIVITALHDNEENVIGFSKVTRDLTEKKIAEDKLRNYAEEVEKKNEKLDQSNKELESFNYIASHDLQEPLRKIRAFSNRVLETDMEVLSEKGKDYLIRMNRASKRMQQLIEDLLSFSRVTSTDKKIEMVDLNMLLEQVKADLKDSIEEKHSIIESGHLPVIPVIPFQFRQVFQNLISNSLKYQKNGHIPHIKISAEIIEGARLKREEVSADKDYCHISVSDNGIGFEQEHEERIFQLFQRLHDRDKYPGSGVGLAICKKVIENHNGYISATAFVDRGATFDIYIPVKS